MNIDNFDIIGWIDTLYCTGKYGPGTKLQWEGATGFDVEKLLARYGIKIYARKTDTKNKESWTRSCRVPATQGRWAEYVLRRAGINLTSPLIDESNRNVQPGPMPPAWGVPAKPAGFVGRIARLMMGEIRYVGKELSIKRLLK